jgi:hypothetical protein
MSNDDLDAYKRGFEAGWDAHSTEQRLKQARESEDARKRQHGLLERLQRGYLGQPILSRLKQKPHSHKFSYEEFPDITEEELKRQMAVESLERKAELFQDEIIHQLNRHYYEEDMPKQPTPQEPKPGETPPDKMDKPYGG